MSDLHLAFVSEEEIVEERAQWRGPDLKARRDGNYASGTEAANASISVWASEGRSSVLGQESQLAEGEEELHGRPRECR